jgi:hypothetical protein
MTRASVTNFTFFTTHIFTIKPTGEIIKLSVDSKITIRLNNQDVRDASKFGGHVSRASVDVENKVVGVGGNVANLDGTTWTSWSGT